MAISTGSQSPKYLKALELLHKGLHPADIANIHVDYDVNTVRKIANMNGVKYEKRSAGVRAGENPSWGLQAAYRQVQKGQSIEQAAATYRVNPKRLRHYVAKMQPKAVQLRPVESNEFEELRAYYRRHSANLRWFQGTQF